MILGVPIVIEWYYDSEDEDMKDGGVDFSDLVEMKFIFIPKP